MAKKVLLTIRIDPEVIDGYGKISYRSQYWSRSAVMAGVLRYVLTHYDSEHIRDMVRKSG